MQDKQLFATKEQRTTKQMRSPLFPKEAEMASLGIRKSSSDNLFQQIDERMQVYKKEIEENVKA